MVAMPNYLRLALLGGRAGTSALGMGTSALGLGTSALGMGISALGMGDEVACIH